MSLIGKKIKLFDKIKGYAYNDYLRHKGQVGIIISEEDYDGNEFDCRVEWDDGEVSAVSIENIIFIDNIILNQILINI